MKRPRFSLRWLLIVVAAFALAFAAVLEIQLWRLPGQFPNVIRGGTIGLGPLEPVVYAPGGKTPIKVRYDFAMSPPFPPKGTRYTMLGRVWLEDPLTGVYMSGYSFDCKLTSGVADAARGEFIWTIDTPPPGRWRLSYCFSYAPPRGGFKDFSWGFGTFIVRKREP